MSDLIHIPSKQYQEESQKMTATTTERRYTGAEHAVLKLVQAMLLTSFPD